MCHFIARELTRVAFIIFLLELPKQVYMDCVCYSTSNETKTIVIPRRAEQFGTQSSKNHTIGQK